MYLRSPRRSRPRDSQDRWGDPPAAEARGWLKLPLLAVAGPQPAARGGEHAIGKLCEPRRIVAGVDQVAGQLRLRGSELAEQPFTAAEPAAVEQQGELGCRAQDVPADDRGFARIGAA